MSKEDTSAQASQVYRDKEYTQIDIVAITTKEIFVVETKNYAAHIQGNAYNDEWTVLYENGVNTIKNSVRQNYGHVEALKYNLSAFPNIRYFSLIVFGKKSSIGEITGLSEDTYVTQVNQLQDCINAITSDKEDTLSIQDIYEIAKIVKKRL